nr:YraN family protein [Wenzhouxiangella sp. XN79A]
MIGQRGERQAERFLAMNGLRPVARNWHCRHGELDLVMLHDDTLVFVEVRMRSPRGFGDGVDSVHAGKQQRLANAAAMFLADHPEWQERPCRFDVIAIHGDSAEIDWLQNAFESSGGY